MKLKSVLAFSLSVAALVFWRFHGSPSPHKSSAQQSTHQSNTVPTMNIQTRVIEQKVPVWAVNHPESNVVTVVVAFKYAGLVGSTPEERGISKLLASLLDEGYGDVSGRTQKEFFLNHMIEYSADSSNHHITLTMRTVRESLPYVFEALKGMLTKPLCKPKDIQCVGSQIQSSLAQKMHLPQYMAQDERMKAAFGKDHPYAFSTQQEAERILSWSQPQLQAYAKKMFTQKRLHVVVVGAYDEKALSQEIEGLVNALPEGDAVPELSANQANNTGDIHIVNMPIPQTVVSWFQEGLPLLDEKFYALYLLNDVLGGQGGITQARLMREIREKRGLAYGVGCSLFAESAGHSWTGGTATKSESAQQVIDLIREQWALVAKDGVTEDELNRVKSFAVNSYPHTFNSSIGTAVVLMRYMLDGRAPDFPNKRNSYIQSVTLNDVNQTAKDVMKDKLTFVVVGNHKAGDLA